MDTQDGVSTVNPDELKDRVEKIVKEVSLHPETLTPSEAHEYSLIVAAHASNLRVLAGKLEGRYAQIKAALIQEGNNGITAKALADGSDIGVEWAEVSQEIKGLDEITKVLKYSLRHFENEGRNIY